MINIAEFAADFRESALRTADVDGRFAEDAFFEAFAEVITASGELDAMDRCYYRGPKGSGIRIDGYGGDPLFDGVLSLVVADFAQDADPARLTLSEMNAQFGRALKFLAKSLDDDWRASLEETDAAFGLADLIAARWPRVTKVRLLLITDRLLSDRVDGRDADEFDGRTVSFSVWDMKRLHAFDQEGRGREPIEIDMADHGGAVPILPAHMRGTGYESYLAVMPATALASIYDRWSARLLEQNVRVFLQARGNVNKGIRRTLEAEPDMFFAYNNGITATAEAVTTEMRGGVLVLTGLRNFQIVNGGQTSASIHAALRAKTDLSRAFVQMKLSVVDPVEAEDVVPRISEYANSQNRVNAADFFSNHPFHLRVKEISGRLLAPASDGQFRQTRWFYERARGEYADARSKLTSSEKEVRGRASSPAGRHQDGSGEVRDVLAPRAPRRQHGGSEELRAVCPARRSGV